jgi:psiF repeat-containing protein
MRVVTLTACAVMSFGLSLAHADDTEKAKARAKACSDQATEKQLNNDELRAFMKACVASEGRVVAPDEPTKARDREKYCATVATSQSLTGADRDTFMKSCIAGN